MNKILKAVLPFAVIKRLSMAYSVFRTLLESPSAAKAMLWGEGERRLASVDSFILLRTG